MKQLMILITFFITTCLFSETITGQGFLKTRDGNIKLCSGSIVILEEIKKEDSLITLLIANDIILNYQDNYNEYLKSKELFDSVVIDYFEKKLINMTYCDADGNFEFKNIKEGKYKIATTIDWFISDKRQGGFVYKTVEVKNNIKVYLTTLK